MREKDSYINRTLEFHRVYETEVKPLFMEDEEPRRLQKLSEIQVYRIFILIALLVVLAIGGLITKALYPALQFAAPMFGIGFFSLTIILTAISFDCFNLKFEKEYKTSLKENYLDKVLQVFGDIKWEENRELISNNELERSGLFPPFAERHQDDSFVGVYKGVNFIISETKLTLLEKGKRDLTSPTPFFKGCLILFDMNKNVKNRTIVATKNSLTSKHSAISHFAKFSIVIPFFLPFAYVLISSFGVKGIIIDLFLLIFAAICVWLMGKYRMGEKLEKMKLEDLKFNNLFVSYSSSQVEGRYLVTPAFMERFLNLRTAFGTKKVKCSFYEDKLMIAIETKRDLFEIGDLHKSLNNPESINNLYNELSSIYRMIDYFKLDEKTGL